MVPLRVYVRCCVNLETARKQTQHKWSKENRRTTKKLVYVRFVPQLTNDWHGVNESYGRWIKHVIECGLLSLFAHFDRSCSHCFPLCVCCSVLVCVSRCMWCSGSFSQPLCRYRGIRLPSWFVGCAALCVWECAFFCLRFGLLIRSLGAVVPSVYHLPRVYYVSTLVQHACTCVCVCMCFISLLLLSHSVCITSEPSYAGVLLHGSACYILSCVRYGTLIVVYGMRTFWLNSTVRTKERMRWIVCVRWPNVYKKHRYISQHNKKTEKNKWINTFRIVAQITTVLVFKCHTQTHV